MNENVSVVGGVAEVEEELNPESSEGADGEGMKDIDNVPLNRTTETAKATGITATKGFG